MYVWIYFMYLQYLTIHHLNQLLALCINFRWSPILLLLHPDCDDLAMVVDLFELSVFMFCSGCHLPSLALLLPFLLPLLCPHQVHCSVQ